MQVNYLRVNHFGIFTKGWWFSLYCLTLNCKYKLLTEPLYFANKEAGVAVINKRLYLGSFKQVETHLSFFFLITFSFITCLLCIRLFC